MSYSRRLKWTSIALFAAGVVVTAAVPAHASTPWDGENPLVGPNDEIVAKLYTNNFFFNFTDIDLRESFFAFDTNTDVLDDFGIVTVVAEDLGISGTPYNSILGTGSNISNWASCGADPSVVSVSEDVESGDVTFSCSTTNAAFAQVGLAIDLQFRVYADGRAVRHMVTITNLNSEVVELDHVIIETEFGSDGRVIDYEGQSDDFMTVPYVEEYGTDLAPALNAAESRWIVHDELDIPGAEADMPGAFIIGGRGAELDSEWLATDADTYLASVSGLAIPAGGSRAIVTFAAFEPEPLIGIGYTNDPGEFSAELEQSTIDLLASVGRFAELEGPLAAGIQDPSIVVNWPAPTTTPEQPEEPQLAETGPANLFAPLLALAAGLGLAGVWLVRRRTARPAAR